MLHPLLNRQLRKLSLTAETPPSPEVWRQLLDRIDRTYVEAAQERYTLERSIGISSEEMRDLHARVQQERDRFFAVMYEAPIGLAQLDANGIVRQANALLAAMVGPTPEALAGRVWASLVVAGDLALPASTDSADPSHWECRLISTAGTSIPVMCTMSSVASGTGDTVTRIIAIKDLTEEKRLEIELRHAHKLEAVGRLAAGIAHEVNTPIQFIGDNTAFLSGAFDSLFGLARDYAAIADARDDLALATAIAEAEQRADLAYLRTEVPTAITALEDGVNRVATIVSAMKAFAHEDGGAVSPADLNAALQSTLAVARHEIKYVADVRFEPGPLPDVVCYLSDLNQVFLNLLVNAAHAIADALPPGGRGSIRVRTWHEGSSAVVAISDTGTGIAPSVQPHIFDPFFTTKEVGRGSGQGLALAHAVVAEKHKGSLTFETELGQGTTFFVRIPIDGPAGATRLGAHAA